MREFPLYLIPLLPLFGALVCLTIGRKLDKFTLSVISCGVVVAAFAVGLQAILEPHNGLLALRHAWHGGPPPEIRTIAFNWITVGSLKIDASFVLDPLSAVMVMVVTGIGTLIHVYSYGYMHEDRDFARFMGYLNLFTGAMLVLVTAGNMVLMFVGWEGVGLCSYLLIGFWYDDETNASAGRKAFVVNRIGDLGFLLGIFLLVNYTNTVDFQQLAVAVHKPAIAIKMTQPSWLHLWPVTWACLLLFVGATGKSAQLPLFVWLPDAMKGPTPVSALIHAATMVTAGVYMIVRLNFLFSMAPFAMAVIAYVGMATALFAAILGCVATDLKKVLAYSTVSQLGFMFVAVGTGGFAAGTFHLFTHAFFKACLFLGAGSVLHALHLKQGDIRDMGGLAHKLPITRMTFLISCLAIAGVPGLSGFFSKDEVLWSAFSHGNRASSLVGVIVYPVMLITAVITAFYMFRLYFMTFTGAPRATREQMDHAHEAPPSMGWPLIFLATGAAVTGLLWLPHFLHSWGLPNGALGFFEHWLQPVTDQANMIVRKGPALQTNLPLKASATASMEMILSLVSFVALIGVGLAWVLYRGGPKPSMAMRAPEGRFAEVAKAGFFDWFYDWTVVRPYRFMSRQLWQRVDKAMIDTLMVRGTARLVDVVGGVTRLIQNGDVQRYAVMILIGTAALMFWVSSPSAKFQYKVIDKTVVVRASKIETAAPSAPDADRLTYRWNWNWADKEHRKVFDAEGPDAQHVYREPGKYEIRLEVNDPRWHAKSTETHKVEVR